MTQLPNGIPYTKEEIAKWREFLAEPKHSYRDAAAKFGVGYATVRRHVPDLKFSHLTPETLAEWDRMLDEGYAYKHIAEIYRVAKSTVQRRFPGRGWTPEQIVAHGTLVRNGNRALARV